MRNHRFVSPFWHHFWCLLAYFFYIFLIKFWDAFLNATFPFFIPKWLPKWSDQKALRKLLGAPGRQRRPKGLSKTNNPPRAFLNRIQDGSTKLPGPSRCRFLHRFWFIRGQFWHQIWHHCRTFWHHLAMFFRDLFLDTFLDASILGALFLDTDQANQRSASQNTTNHVT